MKTERVELQTWTFDSERRQWRAEFGGDYGFGTTPRNAIANVGQYD